MAVPVRLRSVPEYLRNTQFTNYHNTASDGQHTESQELLQFPKSTCILWDGTSTGDPVFLHVARNRKPKLLLWEKLLWLIHKQVDSNGSANRALVGSLSVGEDADGVSFKIDRLDTRQADVNASLLQDDVMIPVQISSSSNLDRTGGSREDYIGAVKMLQKRCSSHEALELNSLLLVKGWCSVRCHQQAEKTVAHLQFDVVTLASEFKGTPVNPVPIIPSALAKNLSGPRSLSQMQGRPKMGYLSMDSTRKLLLVLESDPKVSSLPVVGIWVSGVSMVHHPFVWGACLRYLQNERLQDRVCTPPEGFLLVVYSSLHSKPEFYEMTTTSGKSDLEFDLYTGYEVTTLHKKSSGPEPGILEWELSPVRNGPKRELFDAALESIKSQRQEAHKATASPALSISEDIVPRMTPAPHQPKAMTIRPMVPEVSMIWNDENCPAPSLLPYSSAPHHSPPCLNTAFNSSSSAPVSVTTTPGPGQRKAINHLPSSGSCDFPATNPVLTGSSASDSYHSSNDRHHQNTECLPRTGFPVCYPQPQTGYEQSKSARTHVPGISSSGLLGAAYNKCLAQSAVGKDNCPCSQPGSQYNNSSVPHLTGSQGHACATVQQCAHPQQQMFSLGVHDESRPQPQPQAHPQPRMVAPTGIHFCRPPPAVRPAVSFPQPSQPVQRLADNSTVPQPAFSQGQHFCGRPSVPSSHPQAHVRQSLPWPAQAHPLAHTDHIFMPQVTPVSQTYHMNHVSNAPGYHSSAQGPITHPQGMPYQSPATGVSSQGLVRPPATHMESSGPPSWQQHPGLAKDFHAQTLPDMQPSSMNSYAQCPQPGMQSACQPFQGHPHASGPLAAQGPDPSLQTGNDSHHADSTSCSGKSSDDSGLSVTPDRSNPSPKLSHSTSTNLALESALPKGLEGLNLAGVSKELVQFIIWQASKVEALQAQLEQFKVQQASASSPGSNSSTPTAAPSLAMSTPSTLKRETHSTGVNTTVLEPRSPQGRPTTDTQCASIQTSPQMSAPHHFSPHPHRSSPSSSSHSQEAHPFQQRLVSPLHQSPITMTDGSMNRSGEPHTPGMQKAVSVGETPSDIRHEGPVVLSSTEREETTVRSNSLHSCGSLEQPSPVRSMESHLQMSDSTPSPLSASMCVRPDENDEENIADVSPESKEYYDQLISNIRLFLNSHSQDADNTATDNVATDNVATFNTSADCTAADKTDMTTMSDDVTTAQLKMFDSAAASPSVPSCPSGGISSSNTTLVPHINYLSMMLESDTDASLEINAMAMKYLRDEQLTQVARHHQSPGHLGSHHHLLRQALAASLNNTTNSDISRLSMSPNNMSMATKKYMEKYGLLGGGQGESLLDANQTIRLQTDFSLAVMSETHSSPSLPPSPKKATIPQHMGATPSPVKREVLQPPFKPSPVIIEERETSYGENDRMRFGDLGASPALRPPQRYHRDSSEDSPIFPERYHGPQHQDLIGDCSLATEDDRILDIEKLKQMPKLL